MIEQNNHLYEILFFSLFACGLSISVESLTLILTKICQPISTQEYDIENEVNIAQTLHEIKKSFFLNIDKIH